MNNIIYINPNNSSHKSEKKDFQSHQKVSIAKRRDTDFPIVTIKDRGYIHMHANGFLLTRYNHPSIIDEILQQSNNQHIPLSHVTKQTIQNYAEHIRYWLNICALLETSYLYADYNFLQKVLMVLREDNVAEGSLSQYISTWRLFYKYLEALGVPHQMDLPDKVSVSRMLSDAEQSGDFLNYTRKSNNTTVTVDPLVDASRIIKHASYTSQVLTQAQMKELISELRKIDIIYGVMAKVQFDTCLRISELVNYFPHTSNPLNPKFKCWGEMHVEGIQEQKFNFIGKGQIKRDIEIDIRTLELIETKFLTAKRPNSDISLYTERKHKFLTYYLQTKLGKESKYTYDSDILWLTENGHPVSNDMYRDAFREASIVLKKKGIIPSHIHVRPHAMRHTGATLRLVNYREETGVDIHVKNDGDIHTFLQKLLGHSEMATTHKYIRTVRDKTFSNLAYKTIIKNEEVWDDELKKNPALRKGVDAIKNGI
jgi:integrase